MNIAAQIDDLEKKGFRKDQAVTVVLMKQAAVALFQDFPDAFVLFGGATLVLFHNSVRQSNDLDLLSRVAELPSGGSIVESLKRGLESVSEALNVGPLQFVVGKSGFPEVKVSVENGSGAHLFRVDLNRKGSVIETEIEEHEIQVEEDVLGIVKSASKDFLLLQKAEAFLQRRQIKARDAYDIHLLLNAGASLNEQLRGHLSDSLMGEFGSDEIRNRIHQLTFTRCRVELRPILPPQTYEPLEAAEFKPLLAALESVYAEWL
jgi:hypothetical protein